MKAYDFLKQFQQCLQKEEYDCTLIEATEATPYTGLLVFLGLDEKDRERVLEISIVEQESFKKLRTSKSQELNLFRIQFQTKLPFEIQPEACSQVSSLICYLNRLIELPGFEMDEINLQLFHRYVLIYGESSFNKTVCISIVGFIMLLLELFSSTLERLAQGETTFNQLLEEIVEIGNKLH